MHAVAEDTEMSVSYPVLLGRRFMRDDNILIDSGRSFIVENECEYSTLEELAKSKKALTG